MSQEALRETLTRHEGRRLFAYLDCCGKPWRQCPCIEKGKLTIGVGRNLDDVGLSDNEVDYLLDNDLGRVRMDLDAALPWWREHSEAIQHVLINMTFNLGMRKFQTFVETLGYIRLKHYRQAADNLRKTLWHRQVKSRALEIEAVLDAAEAVPITE